MKIIDFKLSIIKNELKKPFVTNIRRVDAIEDVCLMLIANDGTTGYGEAPPTVAITGESIEVINKTIKERIFPAISGVELDGGSIFEALHTSVLKSTSAKACVDMALYDILSKSKNMPLYKYLGGSPKTIKTNLTISLGKPQEMLRNSVDAFNSGFEILKIKVGKDEAKTIEAIRNIREALPTATLRVDANQAWDAATALRIIEKISNLDIELIEQPTKADDLNGLKDITSNSTIPILADEAVFGYDDALRILNEKAADFINIKLMKAGGIHEALKIAKLAKQRGSKVMMGSMLESVISVSAAVHLAMSDDNICFYDLDGPLLAKPSDVKNSIIFNKDEISLSPCLGLGISLE